MQFKIGFFSMLMVVLTQTVCFSSGKEHALVINGKEVASKQYDKEYFNLSACLKSMLHDDFEVCDPSEQEAYEHGIYVMNLLEKNTESRATHKEYEHIYLFLRAVFYNEEPLAPYRFETPWSSFDDFQSETPLITPLISPRSCF